MEGFLSDDVGINISEKNKNYCELTGLYWIWKNSDFEYVGLIHYRRLFLNHRTPGRLTPVIKYIPLEHRLLTANTVIKILRVKDIILPLKIAFAYSVKEEYERAHYKKDLELARQGIKHLAPDYLETFDKVMNRKYLHPYNMFVAKKALIDRYCEWLFSILEYIESKIDMGGYDQYQRRVYGFLAERLFNVWIEKNKLTVAEKPIIYDY